MGGAASDRRAGSASGRRSPRITIPGERPGLNRSSSVRRETRGLVTCLSQAHRLWAAWPGPVTQSGLRAGSASEGPAAGSPPTAGGRRGARCPRASAQPAAGAVNPSLCARGGTHTPTLACGYAHTHTRTRVLMRKCPATLRPVDQRCVRTGPGGPLTPAHPAARPGTREGATPTLPRHTGAALSIAHTPARVRGSAQTWTCTRTAGPESARATLAGRHRGGLR